MSPAAMTFAQWRTRRRATALSVARAEGLDVVADDPTLLLACGAAGADRAGFGMSSDAASAHRLLDLLGQGYRPMFLSCIAPPEGIGEALHGFGYEEEDPGELVGMGHSGIAAIAIPSMVEGLRPHPLSASPAIPYDLIFELGRLHDPTYPPDDTAFRAVFPSLVDATILLVDDGGTAAATASLRVAEGAGALMAVVVAASWRGRGVGTLVTALALAEARSRGAVDAVLVATAAGRPIYRRLGFTEVTPLRAFG